MQKFYPLVLGALFLATACQTQIASVEEEVASTQGVSFATAIDSRVAGSVFESGDLISVSAFSDEALSVLYADNVEYEYSNGIFSSEDPILYNLFDDIDALTFRAIYPSQTQFDSEFAFSVFSDQSEGDNYMFSDLMIAQTEATTSVKPVLSFSRLLTQIVVDVRDQDGTVIDDAKVIVYGMTSVDVNLNTGDLAPSGSAQGITAADNGNGSYKVVLPAQSYEAGDIFIEVIESDGTVTTKELPSGMTLESGSSYNVDITIVEEVVVEYYADGDVVQWMTESAGASSPVHLIIVGDGYIEEDYAVGGAFDQDAQTAINSFFALEPYATYKDYFRVSTVAAFSEERGATVQTTTTYDNVPAQDKNTVFSSILAGGSSTGISCDYDAVYEYAYKVPGVGLTQIQGTTIIVMINLEVYAGTCMMSSDGKSVSMCPVGSTFSAIVQHEAGGHGFGRLLDEYRYYSSSLPSSSISTITTFRKYDTYFGYNIDLTGSTSEVHWKDYFSRDGYGAVDLIEGGYLYYYDVWRPETISCMEDNRGYYNAPSREAMVRRIFSTSGSTFNIDDFIAKDIIKSDPYAASAPYLGAAASDMPHLGEPILVVE
ncbi:MAG: fimbrillin family protein [Rikenellaceae bacterium]